MEHPSCFFNPSPCVDIAAESYLSSIACSVVCAILVPLSFVTLRFLYISTSAVYVVVVSNFFRYDLFKMLLVRFYDRVIRPSIVSPSEEDSGELVCGH